MPANIKELFGTWFIGVVVGTVIIAVTSPLFLRSYAPLTVDSVRQVYTLSQTPRYRWRSEGYADSVIGPLGMPGRSDLPATKTDTLRVALWGDSQTEGVAVSDADKIYAQCERQSVERFTGDEFKQMVVLPFARSGEDAHDWVPQMSRIDEHLTVDVHVFFIAELVDLAAANQSRSNVQANNTKFAYSNYAPAFVIQAARNLFTTGDGAQPRRLRFSLGPTQTVSAPPPRKELTHDQITKVDWQTSIHAITGGTTKPVVIVYGPVVPSIVSGTVVAIDEHANEFERIKQAAFSNGVVVVDVRDDLLDAAGRGNWPHGFHNGQFGSGHLNKIGNEIVARGILRGVKQVMRRTDQGSN
ncbi:hypothetical protein [Planctomycetes bacterium K23_9]